MNRRNINGYVEEVSQGFQTFQNSKAMIPVGENWHPERAIDNAVNLQPHPGVMFVRSIPGQTNRINGTMATVGL